MGAARPSSDLPPVVPAIFLPARPIPPWKPWLLGIGGLVALGFAGLQFLVQVLTPLEHAMGFPAFIGGLLACSFLAFGAFYQLFQMLQSPHRVELGAEGLRWVSHLRERFIPWHAIGWVESTAVRGGFFGGTREALSFMDPKGRKLATVTDELEQFEDLVEFARQQLGEGAQKAEKEAAVRQLRRNSLMTLGISAVLTAALIYVAVATLQERRDATALEHHGVETEARLDQHYVHFVTPRIEAVLELDGHPPYRYSAAVTQELWNALEGQSTVTVRYVPTDPANFRLAAGEVDLSFGDSTTTLILLVAGSLMVLGLIWLGWLQRSGRDLILDPKTRRWRIVQVNDE